MDISDLNTRQVANALVIFAAAVPFGVEAVAAALMAAGAESVTCGTRTMVNRNGRRCGLRMGVGRTSGT